MTTVQCVVVDSKARDDVSMKRHVCPWIVDTVRYRHDEQ